MLNIFDTHCHLTAIYNEQDSSRLLYFPHNHSVLSVTTLPSEWNNCLSLAKQFSNIHAAIGIHPWYVNQLPDFDMSELEQLLVNNLSIKVLGEIGLDFYPEFLEFKTEQLKCFESQLELANKYSLSVSVHCRKAFDETFNLIRSYDVVGIMHGFSSSYEQATRFISLGMKIGVGMNLLNSNAKKVNDLVKKLALKDIVVETDAPFSKYNGQFVKSEQIMLVIEKVAELKGLPVEFVANQTTINANEILNVNNNE